MEEEVQVRTGTVSWFSARTGYGFIEPDSGLSDLFVHWTNIKADGFKSLKPGDRVSFEVGENHHGEQAINVLVLTK